MFLSISLINRRTEPRWRILFTVPMAARWLAGFSIFPAKAHSSLSRACHIKQTVRRLTSAPLRPGRRGCLYAVSLNLSDTPRLAEGVCHC